MRALPVCVGLLLEYQMTEVRLSSHRFFLKLKYAISVDPCEDDILLQWQMEQDRNCQGRGLKRTFFFLAKAEAYVKTKDSIRNGPGTPVQWVTVRPVSPVAR